MYLIGGTYKRYGIFVAAEINMVAISRVYEGCFWKRKMRKKFSKFLTEKSSIFYVNLNIGRWFEFEHTSNNFGDACL